MLVLKYNILNDKIGEKLNVLIQISKHVDVSELDEFFKKLEDAGKKQDFMDIIDYYTLKNEDVDIEKAINENPDNKLLKEYRNIIIKLKNMM